MILMLRRTQQEEVQQRPGQKFAVMLCHPLLIRPGREQGSRDDRLHQEHSLMEVPGSQSQKYGKTFSRKETLNCRICCMLSVL